jgi:hypothetical protein
MNICCLSFEEASELKQISFFSCPVSAKTKANVKKTEIKKTIPADDKLSGEKHFIK